MWSWLLNPAMLAAGTLAASIPIIIHLLNKRRYRIVEWAAMDFLLEADRKNRRRVRLENLILLALRCLAMFLIGMLLARPLVPSAVQRAFGQKETYERVVLVDDSLSQWVLREGQPSFDGIKLGLKDWLAALARSESSDDWLTLYRTSQPHQPILSNEPVTPGTLAALNDAIDRLTPTDLAADYRQSLQELLRYVQGQRAGVARMVYLFSDLRERDWIPSGDPDQLPQRLIHQIGDQVARGFVIDTGSAADGNLAVTDLRAIDPVVSNRVVRFTADIANFGSSTVRDVRVLMQIDDQPPVYEVVPSLAAGATESLMFRTSFPASKVDVPGVRSADWELSWRNYRLRVEIDRAALGADQLAADQLAADNQRLMALRVADGIPVLLVDGDPSSIPQRSETFFLKYLDVFGTGLKTLVISPSELETVSLSAYEVIYLCNVDAVSRDRVASLEQWIADGGALVLMPGNQVRATMFNESFYRGGEGISPLELVSIAGDPTRSRWVHFEASPQPHPALETIVNTDATSLSRTDIFNWWTSRWDPARLGTDVNVILRLNDEDRSPAMVERSWGRGRVVTFALPGDADWSIWPATPTFVPIMLDLVDYLVGRRGADRQRTVGEPIVETVDLTRYDRRVALRDPGDERLEATARPVSADDSESESELQQVAFEELGRQGFYEVTLTKTNSEPELRLWALNLPPGESRLKRLSAAQMDDEFWGDQFERLNSVDEAVQRAAGQQREFWPYVVIGLLLVLGTEQFLGWWFGRRR